MLILNEAKPKYEHLDMLLGEYISNLKFSNNVTIIIDLKEFFKKFHRPDCSVDYSRNIKEELTADILNTVGHYRNYFFKKGKRTTFFILYSKEKCSKFLELSPQYKEEYYEKYFSEEGEDSEKNKIFKIIVAALEKLTPVIPNVNFIDCSRYDEYLGAKLISEKTKENELLFILSNDTIFYQLLKENVFVITLKGIKSELITEDNFIEFLTKGTELEKFSLAHLPLFFSISGIKKYSINGIKTVGNVKASKIIKYLEENKILTDVPTLEFPLSISSLETKSSIEKQLFENKELLEQNYLLVTGNQLYLKIKSIIEAGIYSTVATPKLKVVFQELNAKVFVNYPLQLDMLLKGETI